MPGPAHANLTKARQLLLAAIGVDTPTSKVLMESGKLDKLAGARPIPSHETNQPWFDPSIIYRQYPALAALGHVEVVDSRARGMQNGGGLEFYPPDEAMNPRPGNTTIEIFNPELQGDELNRAVAGDMLHGLPTVDPTFAGLRSQFLQTLTPDQLAFDQRTFENGSGEPHDTFESWMDRSRLDSYIRGYLFPDRNDEWRKSGVYTTQQQQLLERMRSHLLDVKPMPSHGVTR